MTVSLCGTIAKDCSSALKMVIICGKAFFLQHLFRNHSSILQAHPKLDQALLISETMSSDNKKAHTGADEVLSDTVLTDKQKRKAATQSGGDVKLQKVLDDEKEKQEPVIGDLVGNLLRRDYTTCTDAIRKLYEVTDDEHADHDSNRKEVFLRGGHVLILMKIKKNLDRACGAELLGTCFGILVDLTVEDERCNIIAQHPDAIAISVMAMRTYPDQKPVCTHACNLLANFCDTDDSKRVAIFEAGIIPLVNAMMMKFPDDEDVQHRGALLVNNLLRSKRQYNKILSALSETNILVALAAAKCKFRNNYQIQGYTTCSINEINKVQSAKSKN